MAGGREFERAAPRRSEQGSNQTVLVQILPTNHHAESGTAVRSVGWSAWFADGSAWPAPYPDGRLPFKSSVAALYIPVPASGAGRPRHAALDGARSRPTRQNTRLRLMAGQGRPSVGLAGSRCRSPDTALDFTITDRRSEGLGEPAQCSPRRRPLPRSEATRCPTLELCTPRVLKRLRSAAGLPAG